MVTCREGMKSSFDGGCCKKKKIIRRRIFIMFWGEKGCRFQMTELDPPPLKKKREIDGSERGSGWVGWGGDTDMQGPFQSISPLIFLVKQSN